VESVTGRRLASLRLGLLDPVDPIFLDRASCHVRQRLVAQEGDQLLIAQTPLVAFDVDGIALRLGDDRKLTQKLLCGFSKGLLGIDGDKLTQLAALELAA
jgi:hypothetical protein